RLAQRYAAFTLLAVVVAAGALLAPKVASKLRHVDLHAWTEQFSSIHPDGEKTHAGVGVTPPGRTPIEGDGKPLPVVLNFSASAAPLARVGKEAQDVTISPAIAGKWIWT